MESSEFKIHELVFAQGIGVDLDERHAQELIELAVIGMNSLPPGWEVGVTTTENGELPYFFDSKTQSSVWIHPNHQVYCKMIADKRKELIRTETPRPPVPETNEDEHLIITESSLLQHNQILSQQNSRTGTVLPSMMEENEEMYMYYDENGEPVVDQYHNEPNTVDAPVYDDEAYVDYEIGPNGELIEVHKEEQHVDIGSVQQTILDMKAQYEKEIAELRSMIMKNTSDPAPTVSEAPAAATGADIQVGGPLETIEERSLENSSTVHEGHSESVSKGEGTSSKSNKSSKSQSRLQYFDEETNSSASDEEDLYSGTTYGAIRDKVSGIVGAVGKTASGVTHVVTSPLRLIASLVKISPNKGHPKSNVASPSSVTAPEPKAPAQTTVEPAAESVPLHKSFSLEEHLSQLDHALEYGDIAEIPDAVLGHHSRTSSSNSSSSGAGRDVPNAKEIENFLKEDIIHGDDEDLSDDDDDLGFKHKLPLEKVPVVEMAVVDQEKYYLGGSASVDYSSLHLQDLADNSKNLFDIYSSGKNTAENSFDEEQWRTALEDTAEGNELEEEEEAERLALERERHNQGYGVRFQTPGHDLANASHDSTDSFGVFPVPGEEQPDLEDLTPQKDEPSVIEYDENGEPFDLLASIREALNMSPKKAKSPKVKIRDHVESFDRMIESPTSHSTGANEDLYERYTIEEATNEDEESNADNEDEEEEDENYHRFKNIRDRVGTPRRVVRTPSREVTPEGEDDAHLPRKSPNQQQDIENTEASGDREDDVENSSTSGTGTEAQDSPLFPSSNFVKNLMNITDKNKNDMFSLIHFIKQNKNSCDVNIGSFLVGKTTSGSGANSKEPSPAKKTEIVYESEIGNKSKRQKGSDVVSQFHDIFKHDSAVSSAEGTEDRRHRKEGTSITQAVSITALLQRKHKKVKEAPKEPEWYTIENKYYSTYKKANAAKIAVEDMLVAHYKQVQKQQEQLSSSQKVKLQRENSEVSIVTDLSNLDSLDSGVSTAQSPPDYVIEIKRDPIRMQWKLECNHYATVQVIHKHYVDLEKVRFMHNNQMGPLSLSTNHYNATHTRLEKKSSLQRILNGNGEEGAVAGEGHKLMESVSDSNVLLLQKKQKIYDAKVVKSRLYKDTRLGAGGGKPSNKTESKLKLPPIK